MRSSRSAPARGQALFALAAVVVSVAAFVWLGRVGAREPAAPTAGAAPSGAWVCPHGGGEDWSVALFLANPGTEPVTARLSELGNGAATPPRVLEVPPGSSTRVDLVPRFRGASTFLEYFGGWIGAGWLTVTGPESEGAAAEPCVADASRRWLLPDATTQLGEDAYAIVANPFDVAAVLDVALFTSDRAPIRDSEWTDLVVPPRRSIALLLNEKVEGEPAVAAELRVSAGRVVAASLGVTDGTGIRSVVGRTVPGPRTVLPVMQGSGQTQLLLVSTADESLLFGATTLSGGQPRPAGGLIEQQHGPAAVRAYAIPVEPGPSAIEVFTLAEATATVVLRALGPGEDPGATAGAVAPAPSWVILPAAEGGSATPGAVLVNASEEDAVVHVELLDPEGGTAAAPITIELAARTAAAVPSEFLASAPGAAVLARSDGAPIVALAASVSHERAFALSAGVPVPHGL